jgi:di/tricarboxylate transporter
LPLGRNTAGWWAGIVLALIFLSMSVDLFEEMPSKSERREKGCSYVTVQVPDWPQVFEESTRFDWVTLGLGIFFGLLSLWMLEKLELPERVVAFLILIVACMSSYLLIYVFLIRKINYLLFSFVMGTILGSFLRLAFFSDVLETKNSNDTDADLRR